jgi:hypothetical protein
VTAAAALPIPSDLKATSSKVTDQVTLVREIKRPPQQQTDSSESNRGSNFNEK